LDQAFAAAPDRKTPGPPIRSVGYSGTSAGALVAVGQRDGEYPWLFSVAAVGERPENAWGRSGGLLKMGVVEK
jgi:hypothetical protein